MERTLRRKVWLIAWISVVLAMAFFFLPQAAFSQDEVTPSSTDAVAAETTADTTNADVVESEPPVLSDDATNASLKEDPLVNEDMNADVSADLDADGLGKPQDDGVPLEKEPSEVAPEKDATITDTPLEDLETAPDNQTVPLGNPQDPQMMPLQGTRGAVITDFDGLKAGFAAAPTDGTETLIEVAGDIDFKETITLLKGQKIALQNASGQKATLNYIDALPFFHVVEGSELTLGVAAGSDRTDFAMVGKPMVSSNKEDHGLFATVNGRLVLNGGDYRDFGSNKISSDTGPFLVAGNKASMEINDGIIQNNQFLANGWGDPWYVTGGVMVKDHGVLVMNGGELKNNASARFPHNSYTGYWDTFLSSGAVTVIEGGTFTLNDGIIHENKSYAGGVLVGVNNLELMDRGATDENDLKKMPIAHFYMNGGTIHNNIGDAAAGGVMVYGPGVMHMKDGVIKENTGYQGGGVLAWDGYVDGTGADQTRAKLPIEVWSKYYPASFYMTGGSVLDNYAYNCGGGVNISNALSEITGGLIAGNYAGSQGGGIYVTAVPNLLKMTNVFVDNNSVDYDGDDAEYYLTEYDGTQYVIVAGSGGGIWFCPTGDAIFHLKNGVIFGDNYASHAGDAFHSEDKMPGYHLVKLPDRTPLGTLIKWYEDSLYNRYANNPNATELDVDALTFNKERTSLEAITPEEMLAIAESFAKVIVKNNAAGLHGGGIGSNGSIIFGEEPVEENPLKDITIEKVWEDLKGDVIAEEDLPDEITVHVHVKVGNSLAPVQDLVLNAANGWKATLENLPATINDQPIEDLLVFTESFDGDHRFQLVVGMPEMDEVQTIEVENSQDESSVIVEYHQSGRIPLTNKKAVTNLLGEKTWHDKGATNRPTEIEVHILQNGVHYETIKVTPNENGDWVFTLEDLPYYDEEQNPYVYDIEEVVPEGYEVSYDSTTDKWIDEETGYIHITFKNTKSKKPPTGPDYVNIAGEKIWQDGGDENRPDAITVELLRNGEVVETITVTGSGDNWQFSFNNLPQEDAAGKPYDYTLREVVPEGYEVSYTGYVITNHKLPIPPPKTDEPDEPEKPPVEPPAKPPVEPPAKPPVEPPVKPPAEPPVYTPPTLDKPVPKTGAPALPWLLLLASGMLMAYRRED